MFLPKEVRLGGLAALAPEPRCHCFRTAREAIFAEQSLKVGPNGPRSDAKVTGNLFVAEASGDEAQNFRLPGRHQEDRLVWLRALYDVAWLTDRYGGWFRRPEHCSHGNPFPPSMPPSWLIVLTHCNRDRDSTWRAATMGREAITVGEKPGTGVGSLRLGSRPRADLGSERFIRSNTQVAAGTLVAGLIGVIFQITISHRFKPVDYGGVFAVLTVQNLIWLPASALTLLMARQVSRGRAEANSARSTALLKGGNSGLLVGGLAIAVGLVLASPFVGHFLALRSEWLAAGALGIPFGLAFPLWLGHFLGEQRFAMFSILLVVQAASRVLGALALGPLMGPLGVVLGVSIGAAATYVCAVVPLRHELGRQVTSPWFREAAQSLAVILPSTLAVTVLLSSDVLLVRHFFAVGPAGQYAAVAALGRALFWGASGVATVLFPKVVFRESLGRSGDSLVITSLGLVSLGGLAAAVVLPFGASSLLRLFAGSAYAPAAYLVPWYVLAMFVLGITAILVATFQSRGRPAFLALLTPITGIEAVALALFHGTLLQVVQVAMACFGGLLAALCILYWIERKERRGRALT